MHASPQEGHDSYVHATLRLILKDTVSGKPQAPEGLIGKCVMFEPLDHPGTTVACQSPNRRLSIISQTNGAKSAGFLIVKGLNGQNGSISLQTEAGCFVYSETDDYSGLDVKLGCKPGSKDVAYRKAASFIWNEVSRNIILSALWRKG